MPRPVPKPAPLRLAVRGTAAPSCLPDRRSGNDLVHRVTDWSVLGKDPRQKQLFWDLAGAANATDQLRVCADTRRELRDQRWPQIRVGSIASLWPSADYFRSSRGNGHRQGRPPCLKVPEPDIRRAYGATASALELRPRSTRLSVQDDRLAARSRSTRSVTSRAIATEPILRFRCRL